MENTKLSQSLEDYLEMVHMLRLAHGIARVKDIASSLSVKMPSVAKAMIELKKLGPVTQEAIADKDACCMEHILSGETLGKIEDFMDPALKKTKK